MVFKREDSGWMTAFIVVMFAASLMMILTGVNFENWGITIWGILILLIFLALVIFILKSAKYYFKDDYLHIKGINYGYWADEKIAYRDILYVTNSRHNKINFLTIIYWHNTQAREITIPAPSWNIANNQAIKMLECIAKKIVAADQSHIISPEFLPKGTNSILVDWDLCLFYDVCQRLNGVYIALIRDNNRVILLGNCERVVGEKIVETTPPKVEQKEYLRCNILSMAHTNYNTVEEALADVKEDENGTIVRVIDCIAEDLHTLPRDTRRLRNLQKSKLIKAGVKKWVY